MEFPYITLYVKGGDIIRCSEGYGGVINAKLTTYNALTK